MGVAVAAASIAALAAAPAAAAPGLPRTYDVLRIDSPQPLSGGAFGWGIAGADFTGDDRSDLLVAQSQTGKGQIFLFDGVTGAHLDTIDPPEKNPPNADRTPADNETLAFVYVETMPDIGSCPGGDGADADEICDLAAIAAGDGIPEILAGSRNLKVDPANGAEEPVASDPNIGRAYVFDGATRAVLKRIDMPAAERATQTAPHFGRLVMSVAGSAPCGGPRAEDGAVGVGACPALDPAVRIGDVNGGGSPDLIVTARNYRVPAASAPAGSQCRAVGSGTCTAGKAWVYAGEQIAGTSPQAILETPLYGIDNPEAQTGGAEFGGNVFRVGDITGDNRPEFVIAARTLDYPLDTPDPAFLNAGAAFLYNGATGALLQTLVNPEPQARAQFSGSFNSGRPVGDLGATLTQDILLGAPLQNALSTDDGRAWVFNGDRNAGGGAEQSWQFATLSDPTPMIGGNFGGSQTGVGDLVGGPEAPANEVLVAGFGPFDPSTEASNANVTDLHIMNPTTQANLQTIPHPDGARGDGFGVGLAPMGDLNGDGFLDFAASAYLANLRFGGQGRAYIFKSNNTPLPAQVPGPPPAAASTPAPAAAPAPATTVAGAPPLPPGACANQVFGTKGDDRLGGTIAGDTLLTMDGDDALRGYQGDDCLDAGAGADRLYGGPDADLLVAKSGNDLLRGDDGRDRLYGMGDRDRLYGEYGRDLLAGGKGDDRLYGGPDADRIFGEAGRDRIHGGDGRNLLDGGAGDDVIDARNGERDTVRCGAGRRDLVRADRSDRVNGCERVRRTGRSR